MATRRKEDMEALHARIRRCAVSLFAERGYGTTSIQAIADAVGISKHALLHHYSCKEALREAALSLVAKYWKDLLPRLVIAATGGDDRLEQLLAEIVNFLKEEPDYCRFLMREYLDRPQEMATEMGKDLNPWLHLAIQLIEKGQEDGSVNPDIDAMAFIWHVGVTMLGCFSLLDVPNNLYPDMDPQEWKQRRMLEMMKTIQSRLLPHAS